MELNKINSATLHVVKRRLNVCLCLLNDRVSSYAKQSSHANNYLRNLILLSENGGKGINISSYVQS